MQQERATKLCERTIAHVTVHCEGVQPAADFGICERSLVTASICDRRRQVAAAHDSAPYGETTQKTVITSTTRQEENAPTFLVLSGSTYLPPVSNRSNASITARKMHPEAENLNINGIAEDVGPQMVASTAPWFEVAVGGGSRRSRP